MSMKLKWITLLLLVAAVAVPPLHADDDDAPKGQPPAPTGGVKPAGPEVVHREMEAMGRAYRIIRKQVSDSSKNASTLAAVLDLEQHTLAAKAAIPRSATTLPTADANKEKRNDYQGDMVTLLRHELDLEEQLIANENDKAVKTVGDLHDLEETGHKEFRPKKEDD